MFSAVLMALPTSSAFAWYDHTTVTVQIQKRLEAETPNVKWSTPLAYDPYGVKLRYQDFASLLLMKRTAELNSAEARSYRELYRLSTEDPDHGMDLNLPDSADPNNDRRFMGGANGETSQGFRHQYWAGWKWNHPLATFQLPPRALGQAPDRADLLATEARDLIRKGDFEWGLRVLGWATHYIQDLTQPFHAVEIPSLRMVPWNALLVWPPEKMFPTLVTETTRTIKNYHWAYEGYVRFVLLKGEASPYRKCFEESAGSFFVSTPRDLAIEVAKRSVKRGPALGSALMELFDSRLKDPGISIPDHPEQIHYDEIFANPDLAEARKKVDDLTCDALKLATDATVWLGRWATESP